MSSILSLVGAQGAIEISQRHLDLMSTRCERMGIDCGQWTWLEPGIAAESASTAASFDALNAIRETLADLPVDVNLVPGHDRRKRVLVCDMDATAIQGETLDDLSTFTPHKAEIDALTRQSVEGSMGFAETLTRRVEMLRGLELEAFHRAHALVKPSPGIRTLVATMQANGSTTALVSGGFRYFTSRVAKELGFAIDIGNELEIRDGRLTGKLASAIVGPEAKVAAVRELSARSGVGPASVLATGDGSNDIAMLRAAGLGVAYRGKPKVRTAICHQINHADLTALLFLQGYHRDEFRIPDK